MKHKWNLEINRWKMIFLRKIVYPLSLKLIRYSRTEDLKQISKNNYLVLNNFNSEFKIIIVTFSKRLFSHCLPLISELRNSGVNQEIYVGINGDFGSNYDPQLRADFLSTISKFQNVNPICFSTFQGLSRMWNRTIQCADADISIVLNDDIIINKFEVLDTLTKMAGQAKFSGFCLLNSDWAHFAIKKNVLLDVGWFDERLLGIGEEDGDFALRFEDLYGYSCYRDSIWGTGLIHDSSADFDGNLAKGKQKYSLFNWVYIEKKYLPGQGISKGMNEYTSLKNISDEVQYPYERWISELSEMRGENNRNKIEEAIDDYLKNRYFK